MSSGQNTAPLISLSAETPTPLEKEEKLLLRATKGLAKMVINEVPDICEFATLKDQFLAFFRALEPALYLYSLRYFWEKPYLKNGPVPRAEAVEERRQAFINFFVSRIDTCHPLAPKLIALLYKMFDFDWPVARQIEYQNLKHEILNTDYDGEKPLFNGREILPEFPEAGTESLADRYKPLYPWDLTYSPDFDPQLNRPQPPELAALLEPQEASDTMSPRLRTAMFVALCSAAVVSVPANCNDKENEAPPPPVLLKALPGASATDEAIARAESFKPDAAPIDTNDAEVDAFIPQKIKLRLHNAPISVYRDLIIRKWLEQGVEDPRIFYDTEISTYHISLVFEGKRYRGSVPYRHRPKQEITLTSID